jgi:hypothetical protein
MSHTTAGSAKHSASTGRVATLMPKQSPLSQAASGRAPADCTVAASAADPSNSHIRAATWLIRVADIKIIQGEKASSPVAQMTRALDRAVMRR